MTSKQYKILITETSVHPKGIANLRDVASISTLPDYAPVESLVGAVREVDAILARTTIISRAVIEAAPRLKIISRHGVGLDNVDLDACNERGVVVTITPHANAVAVSEFALGNLLNVARKLTFNNKAIKGGVWERSQAAGVELHGKTMGIIGLGRIGRRLAKLTSAFEMTILANDPYIDTQSIPDYVSLVDLDTLLTRADFLSIHTPLTTETHHLIGANELGLMKPTAILANTARGGIVDEAALYQALTQHKLAGAALDVFEKEPVSVDHPLLQLDNVICSPHAGGQSAEALVRASVDAAENILTILRGEVPEAIVNPEVLSKIQL